LETWNRNSQKIKIFRIKKALVS